METNQTSDQIKEDYSDWYTGEIKPEVWEEIQERRKNKNKKD